MPKMPQYQRKKRQKPKQRKCQIRKNHIPKHTPMLILNKRRKHEQILLRYHHRRSQKAPHGKSRRESF